MASDAGIILNQLIEQRMKTIGTWEVDMKSAVHIVVCQSTRFNSLFYRGTPAGCDGGLDL